jgi:hypothetical protein
VSPTSFSQPTSWTSVVIPSEFEAALTSEAVVEVEVVEEPPAELDAADVPLDVVPTLLVDVGGMISPVTIEPASPP